MSITAGSQKYTVPGHIFADGVAFNEFALNKCPVSTNSIYSFLIVVLHSASIDRILQWIKKRDKELIKDIIKAGEKRITEYNDKSRCYIYIYIYNSKHGSVYFSLFYVDTLLLYRFLILGGNDWLMYVIDRENDRHNNRIPTKSLAHKESLMENPKCDK